MVKIRFLIATSLISANVRAQLPVPCGGAACGAAGPAAWVTEGAATASSSANALHIRQQSDRATLNWASFDVGEGSSVEFEQPEATSVALNRIFQADPSVIAGRLTANGRVYLINQNGILFDKGAQVDVGGLVASALDITPSALSKGLARAAEDSEPAFAAVPGPNGEPSESAVRVAEGATLEAEGGQILLFAPEVENLGTISTPGGQTILAAGQKVYLAASSDPNLRGLLVEVDAGGTVTNGAASNAEAASVEDLVGRVRAERGNVTFAGLAVRQNGYVSATTAVREGGSIRLLARDSVDVIAGPPSTLLARNGGELTLGERSVTEVALELDDPASTVDANEQPRSSIELDAGNAYLLAGSHVAAPAGQVVVSARSDPTRDPRDFLVAGGANRILVDESATIDVSGADADLPMERNLVDVELRANQLRDSPAQRDGPLRGSTVTVDIRETGVREDGSVWQGTPLADASGEISNIRRTVAERSLRGGEVTLQSEGDVIVAPGASIDVSGGAIHYASGTIATTWLVAADGEVVDIARADPYRAYLGVADSYTREHPRWGVTEIFPGFAAQPRGRYEPGYVEGYDAGALTVVGTKMVLDGDLHGSVRIGRNQRLSPSDDTAAPFERLPLGAALAIGNERGGLRPGNPNYSLASLSFDEADVLPSLANDEGSAFDPLSDALPTDFESRLRPGLLGRETGVTRLAIFSNGDVTLPANVALDLGAYGELRVTAGSADMLGAVTAPGGRIDVGTRLTATTPADQTRLGIGPGARLSVAGTWTNDDPLLNPAGPSGAVVTDGGTIEVGAQQGPLEIGTGALLDVSAGAWRRADGVLEGGRGGSIALESTTLDPAAPSAFVFRGGLRGFGFEQGGALSIAAASICIAETDCGADDPSRLWLSSALGTAGGFESIALTANVGGLDLLPGTQLTLRQDNLMLREGTERVASGAAVLDVARTQTLPIYQRRPVDLDLRTKVAPSAGSVTAAIFRDLPVLSIGKGARIDADPLAYIGLASNTSIVVAGELRAPGGAVDAHLDSALSLGEFVPSQGIWLDRRALIDVGGDVIRTPNDMGRATGTVLAGGSVALRADRGAVVTEPGSLIDIAGAAANLDIRAAAGADERYERRLVSSDAGSVSLAAAETILLNGPVRAAGGAESARGGSLSVTLDAGGRGADPGTFEAAFPVGPRGIVLREPAWSSVVGVGRDLPAGVSGMALLSARDLEASGFDAVSLTSRNLYRRDPVLGVPRLESTGEIVLDGDVSLTTRARIELDAASIRSTGGRAALSSSYLFAGHRDRSSQEHPAPSGGAGDVTFAADLVDLGGSFSLRGIGRLSIESSGDLRLGGLQRQGAREIVGSLEAMGELRLAAAQIYPTTLSVFDIVAVDDDVEQGGKTGRIETLSSGQPGAAPLSAAGTVRLSAADIRHGGVLRAPFGRIEVAARNGLTLDAGSLLSTSGDGKTIPFGATEGGFDWVYPLLDSQTLVVGGDETPVPSQSIALDAAEIDFAEGATLDVSGGGDLLAYEFVPGVGGSTDFLAPDVSPDLYAVLPGYAGGYAPFDPLYAQGTQLEPGASVYLAGAFGLPAGVYPLLPARYGVLPGAYLVRPVEGYRDIVPGESFARLDGSVVVAGAPSIAGTPIRAARTSGYAVRPGSAAFAEADYHLNSAAAFFSARAADAAAAAPRLPWDAGTIGIGATRRLSLNGALRAGVDAGRRGAQVDISSAEIRIADAPAAEAADAVLVLDANQLNALDAESVLIGGRRSEGEGRVRIEPIARNVEIDGAVGLTGPEWLFTAVDGVTARAGARIEAAGAIAEDRPPLTLVGDSGFLDVSAGPDRPVERVDSFGLTGTVTLEPSVRIASPGAVALDVSADASSLAEFDVGGTLRLSASRMSLGDAPAGVEGLVLGTDNLAALSLLDLSLASRSPIDLYGSVSLGVAGGLELSSGGIVGRTDDASLTLQAERVTLHGAESPLAALDPGSARFAVDAREIDFDTGAFGLSGFADAALVGRDALRLVGNGRLDTSGDLSLDGAVLSAASGSRYRFAASGRLAYEDTSGGVGPTGPATGASGPSDEATASAPGGSVELAGRAVSVDSRIDLPAGSVRLAALGSSSGDGIAVGANAALSVAGASAVFDGVSVPLPAGTLQLESRAGGIDVAAGAVLDVSSPDVSGRAGELDLLAPGGAVSIAGALRAGGAAEGRGGRLRVDAASMTDFSALLAAANEAGFDERQAYRLRGPGDLAIGAGMSLTAGSAELTADQGVVHVDGAIGAPKVPGARVVLSGRDGVEVAGRLEAPGDEARISLDSARGPVALLDGATLATAPDAVLDLGVDRARLAAVVDPAADPGVVLAADLGSVARVRIEARQAYEDADGLLTAADTAADALNPLYADAADYMLQAPAIEQALGGDPRVAVVPGIEIRSPGDLTLASDWNLHDWRFDGRPGVLTLRAAGNLTFDASLSDGFSTPTDSALNDTTDSWSYRLVGGADLAAANALTVGLDGAGDLVVSPGGAASPRTIRTGTGRIDAAASRDFVLGDAYSTMYTAGIALDGIRFAGSGALEGRAYPDGGGDISIRAGRDVLGAPTDQYVTDWLWRVGAEGAASSATAWTVNFGAFRQNVGALGGGDVTIEAGRDVRELSASVPSIGRQVGGTAAADSVVEVVGGGNLAIGAARDVLGGKFYVGLGSADVRAGGAIGAAEGGFAPALLLGDGRMAVTGTGGVEIQSIGNPTLIPKGVSQGGRNRNRSYFSTYAAESAVDLLSVAGDVALDTPTSGDFLDSLTSLARDSGDALAFRVLPPTLRAAAAQGDVVVKDSFTLFPAPTGNLELFARGNVRFEKLGPIEVILSDADPELLPSVEHPAISLITAAGALSTVNANLAVQNAARPVHAADPVPARIVAELGDVDLDASGVLDGSVLSFAKPVRIVAGRDIRDIAVEAQHLDANDVSVLAAGRDLIYTQERSERGQITADLRHISIGGPGRLEVAAGRNVDLKTSTGITTTGNIENAALPAAGASVGVTVGLNGRQPDYAAFVAVYLEDSSEYDEALLDFVARFTGSEPASKAEALGRFELLDAAAQKQLAESIFFAELRASGRAAAASPNADFSRGFAALEALFPGSNPDVGAGETNAYSGDLSLYFSKINTLRGGSLSVLAPGGGVNAGLATPPAAFGIAKSPADLGLVVQGTGDVNAFTYADFLVNESRVFAADGGDILIWSTRGDIDAGRGAKTAISAPPPQVTFDANGNLIVVFPAALAGSGIRTLATSPGEKPGNVDLFAPRGVVNAGDAGIAAGNLTIAATAVLGADNIQVSGVSVGVPVDVGGLGASLSGVSAVASSASNAAAATVTPQREQESSTPLADNALGFLEVFVTGFGEGDADDSGGSACDPESSDCEPSDTGTR